jgi:uncharacterized protein (DUF4415 family)
VQVVQREGNIVSYSIDELREMRKKGEDLTDWDRVKALTDEEIEAAIDHEDEGEFGWDNVIVGVPLPKRQITLRLDGDIIEAFKVEGSGYQTRINNVLRSYVNAIRLQALKDQNRKAS